MNFIIEELKDPVKNLPRAIAISMVLVTIVYVFTNICELKRKKKQIIFNYFITVFLLLAFYTILSPQEVLGSEAVAVTFANRTFGMFAWTIPRKFLHYLGNNKKKNRFNNPIIKFMNRQHTFLLILIFRLILVFVAMSTFGAVNGILLTSSRLFYAGANEGQMPEILTMIQIQRLTPAPAVLAISIVSNFMQKKNIDYDMLTILI